MAESLSTAEPPQNDAFMGTMRGAVRVKRALLSVSDKTDLVPFARGLAELGVAIVSTGGTAKTLREAGLEVVSIEDVTGFPEMMDGRVKTLHPAVHGALLARRDKPAHQQAMEQHHIEPIDLVCISLYPFERTILQEAISREEAIEQIDIGGPAMLRSAAKNHDAVTVVTSPAQYDRVVNELREHNGGTTLELRRELAAAAFTRTAEYDTAISAWMSQRNRPAFPQMLRLTYSHALDLRYGENPHQSASLYRDPTLGEPNVVSADMLHGKPLSYNNINDASAALLLVTELSQAFPGRAAAVIVKHTNACGASISDSPADAFLAASQGDPLAAYGGVLALSENVDARTAETITSGDRFLEVVVAPSLDRDATAMLGERWANVRLLACGSLQSGTHRAFDYHSVPGGMLVQERDRQLPVPHEWHHVAGPLLDAAQLEQASFVWLIAKHLKSNAIAIGGEERILGVGCGQVDRVTAARIAIEKAGDRMQSVALPIAASDAFFPFPDGPELLIRAGVKCIIHPGGSKRDRETIELCERSGVTCVLTGVRHFKH